MNAAETQADRYALLSASVTTATIAYVTNLLDSTQQDHYIGQTLMTTRLARLRSIRQRALDVLEAFVATDDITVR